MSAVPAAAAAIFPNVLVNGGFEEDQDADGKPDGWQLTGLTTRVQPGAAGSWAFELSGTTASRNASMVQTASVVQPAPSTVTLACLVKGTKIRRIGGGDGVAKLTISFFDKNGRLVSPPRTLASWEGTFDWKLWVRLIRIPSTATKVDVALALSGATGQAVFDDVELLWNFPDDYDRQNLIVDGGFEYFSPLSAWTNEKGAAVRYRGFNSHAALVISLSQAGRSAASQPLVIDDPAAMRNARLELYLKPQSVVAASSGGGAKAELRFWDSQRRAIEPAVVLGPWTGTTANWTLRSSAVTIPLDAREATISLMLDGASGTASFDQVRFTASSSQGSILRRVESRNEITSWQTFSAVAGPLVSPLDASPLLSPPAGKHGFLTVGTDGHFIFADGTPIRFFGMNVQGAFALPTHADADALAERLAQLGCNLVRLHRLDSADVSPNLFDPAFDDTQHFSADSLDRLDYFIHQLKARGIYVYLDLLVSRQFKGGDAVAAYAQLDDGAKIVAEHNPRIIELQKLYASSLLTHVNPYTNTRLVDEPALVLVALINESSLFSMSKSKAATIPQVYLDELQQLWIAHLTAQGVPNPELEASRYLDVADPEVQAFYASLQTSYFQQMHAYLRSIGLKIPIAGSNLTRPGRVGMDRDLLTNASLDFIDRHGYWDHPNGGFGDLVKVTNRLMTESSTPGNPVVKFSQQRVAGKPLVVSEWNAPWPNEYRAAAMLLMAAYAAFQDWDGLIQFTYDGKLMPTKIQGNFDVSTKPELFMQVPLAARLFHRRDVEPARVWYTYRVVPEPPIPGELSFLHGIKRIVDGVENAPPVNSVGPWLSDTNELTWDAAQGVVRIDTSRTQAAIGRVGTGAPLALRDVTFSVATPFSSLALTSLDGQPLASSRHLLLTTVARAENTGTIYNATRTLLRSPGTSPIVMEPTAGTVQLPVGGRVRPEAFVLDAGGHRGAVVPVTVTGQVMELPLGQGTTYDIVFGDGGSPPLLDPIGNRTVNEGTLLAFTVTASDPDGNPLTFSASNLPLGATFTNAIFSWVPDFTQAGTYPNVHFEVSDGALIDSENITITVLDVSAVNRAPVAHAGVDQTVTGGSLVSLTGSGSSDPDGNPLSYQWTQTAGPVVSLSNPTSVGPTFTAPAVTSDTTMAFRLTVSDGSLSASDDVTIIVTPVATGTPQTPWQTNAYGTLGTGVQWHAAGGYHFTPLVSGQVTHLGGFFNGTKTVKLFNKATGALLATASVTAANTWSYAPVGPVTVSAGTTYTVAVYLAGSGGTKRTDLKPKFPRTFGDIQIIGATVISTSTDPNARPTKTVTDKMLGQADVVFVPSAP